MTHDNCCPICLDDFDDVNEIFTLKCNHVFHRDCINEWLLKRSTCPYCRIYLKDTVNVMYQQGKYMFLNKAIIILPKDNLLEMKFIFPKKLFSKSLIINRFTLKSYTIHNNNKLVITYFVKIPDKTKILSFCFQTSDDLNECCRYFRKMFEYNEKVKLEEVTALL